MCSSRSATTARARTVLLSVAVVAGVLIEFGALTDAEWLAWARGPILIPLVLLSTLLTRPSPQPRVLIPLSTAQVFA